MSRQPKTGGALGRWALRAAYTGILVFAGLYLASSCAAPRHVNAPLTVHDPNGGYRFELAPPDAASNSNGLFVCLVMSGGGTRAAALSYGVLEELRDHQIEWPTGSGRRVSLLSEVDVISAISGGSFTAAYYGLFGDQTFARFRERVLYRDITGGMLGRTLDPRNWPRLMRADVSRIDLAAEHHDEEIFERKTFADMRRRPFIVISATNVTFGARFSFTQPFFDLLGSDLSAFPVGRAVAASSAFPLLLSPLTLHNHKAADGYRLPEWIEQSLVDPWSKRRPHALASRLAPYHLDKAAHPYLHLLDGGLSDNLGLRYVIDSYLRGEIRTLLGRSPSVNGRPVERIERLVVLVVNAKGATGENLDTDASPPSEVLVGYKTATVSMDNYTFETVELMEEFLGQRRQSEAILNEANLRLRAAGAKEFPELSRTEAHLIEISLEQIVDAKDRADYLATPTDLVLPRERVDGLIEKGRALLRAHPEFRALLQALR
ncbi:MAG: patatin-like phospholipase family protein [Planctomycetota bacterium]